MDEKLWLKRCKEEEKRREKTWMLTQRRGDGGKERAVNPYTAGSADTPASWGSGNEWALFSCLFSEPSLLPMAESDFIRCFEKSNMLDLRGL